MAKNNPFGTAQGDSTASGSPFGSDPFGGDVFATSVSKDRAGFRRASTGTGEWSYEQGLDSATTSYLNARERLKAAGVDPDTVDGRTKTPWWAGGLKTLEGLGIAVDWMYADAPIRMMLGGVTSIAQGRPFAEGAASQGAEFDKYAAEVDYGDAGWHAPTGKELIIRWGIMDQSKDRKGKVDLIDVLGVALEIGISPSTWLSMGMKPAVESMLKGGKIALRQTADDIMRQSAKTMAATVASMGDNLAADGISKADDLIRILAEPIGDVGDNLGRAMVIQKFNAVSELEKMGVVVDDALRKELAVAKSGLMPGFAETSDDITEIAKVLGYTEDDLADPIVERTVRKNIETAEGVLNDVYETSDAFRELKLRTAERMGDKGGVKFGLQGIPGLQNSSLSMSVLSQRQIDAMLTKMHVPRDLARMWQNSMPGRALMRTFVSDWKIKNIDDPVLRNALLDLKSVTKARMDRDMHLGIEALIGILKEVPGSEARKNVLKVLEAPGEVTSYIKSFVDDEALTYIRHMADSAASGLELSERLAKAGGDYAVLGMLGTDRKAADRGNFRAAVNAFADSEPFQAQAAMIKDLDELDKIAKRAARKAVKAQLRSEAETSLSGIGPFDVDEALGHFKKYRPDTGSRNKWYDLMVEMADEVDGHQAAVASGDVKYLEIVQRIVANRERIHRFTIPQARSGMPINIAEVTPASLASAMRTFHDEVGGMSVYRKVDTLRTLADDIAVLQREYSYGLSKYKTALEELEGSSSSIIGTMGKEAAPAATIDTQAYAQVAAKAQFDEDIFRQMRDEIDARVLEMLTILNTPVKKGEPPLSVVVEQARNADFYARAVARDLATRRQALKVAAGDMSDFPDWAPIDTQPLGWSVKGFQPGLTHYVAAGENSVDLYTWVLQREMMTDSADLLFPTGMMPKTALVKPDVWIMDDEVPVDMVWKSIDDNPDIQVDDVQAVVWSRKSAYKTPLYYQVPEGRDLHKFEEGYLLADIDDSAYGIPAIQARFTPYGRSQEVFGDVDRTLKLSVDVKKPLVIEADAPLNRKFGGPKLLEQGKADPFAAIIPVPGLDKPVRLIDLPDLGYDAIQVNGKDIEVLLLPDADLFHSMMREKYAARGRKFKAPIGADASTLRSERPLTFIISNDQGDEIGRRMVAGPEAAAIRGNARSGSSKAMRTRAIERIPELADQKFIIENSDGFVRSARVVAFDRDVLPSYAGAQALFHQDRYPWMADAHEWAERWLDALQGEPAPMFHATTAAKSVLKEGLKARDELGGIEALGSGPSHVVSVTFNEARAQKIVEALKIARSAARDEVTSPQILDLAEELHQTTLFDLPTDPTSVWSRLASVNPHVADSIDAVLHDELLDAFRYHDAMETLDEVPDVFDMIETEDDMIQLLESTDVYKKMYMMLDVNAADPDVEGMSEALREVTQKMLTHFENSGYATSKVKTRLFSNIEMLIGSGTDEFGGTNVIGIYGQADFFRNLEDDDIDYFQVFAKTGSAAELVSSENELRFAPENLVVVDRKGNLVGRPLKVNPVKVKFSEPTPMEFKTALKGVDPEYGMDIYPVSELKKMKRFYDPESGIGFALKRGDVEGTTEIVSMFRNPGSRYKGGGAHAVVTAVQQAKDDGARKIILDVYDMTSVGKPHGLVQFYEKFGFKPSAVYDWDPQYANKTLAKMYPTPGEGPLVVIMELDDAGWEEFLRKNPKAIDQGIIEDVAYTKRWTDLDELDDESRANAETLMADELARRKEDTDLYNRYLAGQWETVDKTFPRSLGLTAFDELDDIEQDAIREIWAGTPKAAVMSGLPEESMRTVGQYADALEVLRQRNYISQATPETTLYEAPKMADQFADHLARTEEMADVVRREGADFIMGNAKLRKAERVWYEFAANALDDATPEERRAVSRTAALLEYYKEELAFRDMAPEDLLELFQDKRAVQMVTIDGKSVPVGPAVGEKAVKLFNEMYSQPGAWVEFANKYGLDTGEEGVGAFTQKLHTLSRQIDSIEWPEGLSRKAREKRVQELVGATLGLEARQWDTIDANSWLQAVEQYFPHIGAGVDRHSLFARFFGLVTDESATRNFIGRGISEKMPNVDNMRELRGTIASINNLVGEEKFYEDPAKAMSIYIQRAVQAINAHDFLTEIRGMRSSTGERLILPAKFLSNADGTTEWVAKEGYKTFTMKEMRLSRQFIDEKLLEPDALMGLTKTGKVVFQAPAEIVDDIEGSMRAFFSDEQMQAFQKMYDKVLGVWKGYATVLRPGFHLRNALTNLWQNMTAGVVNPKRYAQAAAIQAEALKIDEFIVDNMIREGRMLSPEEAWSILVESGKAKAQSFTFAGRAGYSMPRLYDMLKEHNIVGSGRIGSDIHLFVDQELERLNPIRGGLNPVSQSFWPMRVGRHAGEIVENNARVAHFLEMFDTTGDAAAAAWSVRKYLFDYTELTPVERNVFKSAMPFYAWWRKNLGLQLEMLVRRPTPIAIGVRLQNRIDQGSHIENQPEWAKGMGGFGVAGITVGTLNRSLNKISGGLLKLDETSTDPVMMSLGLPYQDLMQLNGRDLWGALSPAIKIVAERGTNYNVYFGKPVQLYPGELKTAPASLQAVNNLVQAQGTEKQRAVWDAAMTAFGAGVVDGELKTAPWFNYFYSQFGPHVEAYGKAFKADDEKQAGYIISLLTGVKFTAVDPEKEAYYSMQEQSQELLDLIKASEDRGIDVPTMTELGY